MAELDLADTFALTEMYRACGSIEAVHELTLRLVSPDGIDYVFSGIIPKAGLPPDEQLASVLYGSWPKEWIRRYFHQGYLEQDPTIAHVRSRDQLLNWNSLKSENALVMHEARAFGLCEGMTLPLLTLDGVRIGTSYAGERISANPKLMPRLQIISALATSRVLELLPEACLKTPVANLTPAEFRTLEWIAAGKTNWEIGKILGVSDKTVEKHTRNAMHKLGAVNRTQLVVQAIRLKLIR